jgi:peptidoglycan/xylan/chitin deacetylase (PgdA/CDA1 family)
MLFTTSLLLFLVSSIRAAVITTPNVVHDSHNHENHVYDKSLPTAWFQPADHPVHTLFKRGPTDGTSYAAVGSPEWASSFPTPGATPPNSPPQWIAALNAAVAAGKIPNIPASPYPAGTDPSSPQICSGSAWCKIPGDIFDGPDGYYASSFDDGPYPQTTQLVQFLQAQGQTTTHFMIGGNIILNSNPFLTAFNADHDIAVHTWSHPHMTTLSNEAVVAELGWTMQLIHNSTGGRVPRYWRPPYGDSDMRTRAIAVEVFGLQAIFWNHESNDFALGSVDQVTASLTQIISTSAKSPGAIVLQHEISDPDVNGFIAAYPTLAANGWKFASLARIVNNGQAYQNANSSSSDVSKKNILVADPAAISSTATPTSTSSSRPSATQKTSSGSSLLLSPGSRFLSSIILSTLVFLTL